MRDTVEEVVYPKLGSDDTARHRWWVLGIAALLSVLFQIYVPLFLPFLSYLELPLLVTVYFALMRRSPVVGILFGAGIGLAQDSLSSYPLGMFGITKTLVGYFAGSVGMRFDVEHPVIRLVLAFSFLIFHQSLFWMMSNVLLQRYLEFSLGETLIVALLNSIVGGAFFSVLDKLKMRG